MSDGQKTTLTSNATDATDVFDITTYRKLFLQVKGFWWCLEKTGPTNPASHPSHLSRRPRRHPVQQTPYGAVDHARRLPALLHVRHQPHRERDPRMTRNLAALAAISVSCPICRAPAGTDCRSRKAFHTARAQRGLQRAMRDEHAQHERSWRARARIAEAAGAGRPVDDRDVTVALGSCGCPECRGAVRDLARELHAAGVLDCEAVR